ncbi:MAG TPA: hypothetical protein VJT75_01165 [Thermoleophilaceae bacterium]|nr:hypothetical protein [Thermoleophilaceae bacterium]
MTPFVTAGGAFLLTILYADLMFDVQVARHREPAAPETVLASIADYYRRVTITARPLNRLVVVVMALTLAAIVAQLAGDDVPDWVALASLVLAGGPVALAGARIFPEAVRLGGRSDPPEVQTRLARSIYAGHLICLAGIVSLLVVQLAFAR